MPTPALPRSVRLLDGPGGLPLLRVSTPGGTGEVFLHGAQLSSWTPAGHSPVLWMSDASRFADNTPIRGGVPICFPWFGPHPDRPDLPLHGFARLSSWTLREASEHNGATSLSFTFADSEQTRASVWPHQFEARYTVTIGTDLRLDFDVVNKDTVSFSFEAALHNYYAIGNVLTTRVLGLEGHEFIGESESGRESHPVQLGVAIDRDYPTATTAQIEDLGNHRVITIATQGADGAVLWNPGPDRAREVEDFDDDGWPHMVCFESANIGDSRITLAPGERHSMRTTVTVEHLESPRAVDNA